MRKSFICRASAMLLLALAVGCGAPQDSPTGPSGSGLVAVTGRVVDYLTNAGVSGAVVNFGTMSLTSDSTGAFSFSIPPGTHLVTVDGADIGTFELKLPVHRGDLFVHAERCTAIYGTVIDARSRGFVRGATLEILGVSARSDADGFYRVDLGCNRDFGAGTRFLTVDAAGYFPLSLPAFRAEVLDGFRRRDVDLDPIAR